MLRNFQRMQNSISNKPNQLVSLTSLAISGCAAQYLQFKCLTFDPVQVAHRAGELDLEVQLLDYASRTSLGTLQISNLCQYSVHFTNVFSNLKFKINKHGCN